MQFARLVLMMFLQFFIWGSWYATGGNYMKSHGMSDIIYLAYLASPIGSILSPFFLGMVADRFFPVQKVMGTMHILSGIFVFCAPLFGESSGPVFLAFLLFHMLCYMPTVSLASATAFHLVKDKQKDFPIVRLFGTIGWIGAGILVSYMLQGDTTALPMYIAGAAGVLMGLYSFTLPNIPPRGKGTAFSIRDALGIDALKHLYSTSFLVFVMGLLLISIPFAIYFPYVPVFLRTAGIENPAFKMTFGQMSEVIFLLCMPWFFRKLGIKWVLMIGLMAWAVRYGLFALSAPDSVAWMMIVGILLHGACYDFVYVASQVYIDSKATPAIRAQGQGLFVMISYGIGQGLGTIAGGKIFNFIMDENDAQNLQQWQTFWIIPLIFALVVTVTFAFGFKEKSTEISTTH
ncbi:MAG TPA: MFS transporter [Cyclobacteriaceae bacterium]|nr:MFS transporter [Cyclobacteriaceae bacterium]